MTRLRNPLAAISVALLLSGAPGLAPLPVTYGRERARLEPQGQEQKQEEAGAPAAGLARQRGAGAEHRADPCEHELGGQAYGRGKRCPPQGSSAGIARGDFNGDGFADLAVGVPFEGIGSVGAAGAINVIYGSAAGLTATGNQFWTQDSSGVLDVIEGGDLFGSALASGDFNGDKFSDLAIGAPGEDVVVRSITGTSVTDAGAVHVLYGSASGLASAGNQLFTQNTSGILDASEKDDRFGGSLGWGDFNADGFGDLVVGVPHEDVGTITDAGAVNIIYGSAGGLTATGNQFWHQDSVDVFGNDILEQAEANERFGAALTAGDLNNDGATDLAVGVRFEAVDAEGEGGVHILYGLSAGLSGVGNQFIDNNLSGDQTFAVFGFALAAADFNGDGFADLAIGAPFQDVDGIVDAGIVYVQYGTINGLSAVGDQVFTQDDVYTFGQGAEFDDQFGTALAAGDFNGDGFKDLAVGTPFEDAGFQNEVPDTGMVNFLYGSGGGLNGLVDTHFIYFVGGPEPDGGIRFGSPMSAWNFGNGPQADLAVGIPRLNTQTAVDAGAVAVFYGSTAGLSGAQQWTQDSPGILDQAEPSDRFGLAIY